MTSNSKAQGRYSKLDFIYIAKDNEYLCPAEQRLPYRSSTVENGMKINAYWTSACKSCPQKAKCTTGKERRVKRISMQMFDCALHVIELADVQQRLPYDLALVTHIQ